MSGAALAALYVAFAVVAGAVNLGAQRLVLAAAPPPEGLAAALAVGTAAGLATKYALDKRWIFRDPSRGVRAHARRFGTYALMGVATTLIFWGAELAFWALWRTEAMRELGGALGLAIGYAVKYRLDRRFVFTGGSA
ncbi:GtrA-like protein [Oceanicella actignis]|uniref:GtrA-like protein n=1 Tax=Oceanicella actignis TaxID=1189325 RepID=A0A1M7SW91_9RHOB|nr:GtrA-like protein [Oceanicella actignis]SES73585.1 GtrA-like protein [Oceanicella actignis]SHN62710.1 GtrA-like protein [Oceanicella actignis]